MALGSQFLLRVDCWYSWYQRFLGFLVNKFHRIFDFRFLLGRTGRNNLLQFVDWYRISSGTIQELNGILGVDCSSFWIWDSKVYPAFFFFNVGQIGKVSRKTLKVRG